MEKRLLKQLMLTVVTCTFFMTIHAQQTVMYTQYMFNGLTINPAYAGSDKFLNLTLQGRQQWLGFTGAPTSQMISAHNLSQNKRAGFGMMIERESMGVNETFNGYLMYAYKINFKKGTLSVGLQAGISSYKQQLTDLTIPQGVNDPSFANNASYTLPNFGAGVHYSTERFYVGLSVPYLLQNTFDKSNAVLSARQSRNYLLAGGYVFDLSPSLKLKPNFLIKYVNGAPVNIDINANLLIKEVLWIGCSYRMKNSINPIIELVVTPKLRFGFAYDIPIAKMAGVYSGSPEVMINYRFIKKKKVSRIFSPRYF
jgi:type IX secretion system PorP/SprF family membrane protein